MRAIQVNTQALGMSTICNKGWAGGASALLPQYSIKTRLCYHLKHIKHLGMVQLFTYCGNFNLKNAILAAEKQK